MCRQKSRSTRVLDGKGTLLTCTYVAGSLEASFSRRSSFAASKEAKETGPHDMRGIPRILLHARLSVGDGSHMLPYPYNVAFLFVGKRVHECTYLLRTVGSPALIVLNGGDVGRGDPQPTPHMARPGAARQEMVSYPNMP